MKKLSALALGLAALALFNCFGVAQERALSSGLGLSPNFNQATANALATVNKELQAAARAHGVRINAKQMAYVSSHNLTIVQAPIIGIEKYGEADFAAGAQIQLVIVKSTRPNGIPSGSYVVKAQYRPGATSGKAIFTNASGVVVAQRDLIIRTRAQMADLFPGVYHTPAQIPTITSTHIFDETDADGHGHYNGYFDCSGIDGTLIYPF
jgi:hypothetical protein